MPGGSSKPVCYIAGPMTGIPYFNFPAFYEAEQLLAECGWVVHNPARIDEDHGEHPKPDGVPDHPRKYYMQRDLPLVCASDAIFVLPGWHRSAGAKLEVDVALRLDIPVYKLLDMWDNLAAAMVTTTELCGCDLPASECGPDRCLMSPTPLEPETITAHEYFSLGDLCAPSPFLDSTSKATNPKDAVGSSKMPLHLWPTTATTYGCLGLLEGMLKYGRSNWREAGVRYTIYHDAVLRHLQAAFEGEWVDPDSGLPHLSHALACLGILVDAYEAGKLTDDRAYNGGGYRRSIDRMTPEVERLKEKYSDRSPQHYDIRYGQES